MMWRRVSDMGGWNEKEAARCAIERERKKMKTNGKLEIVYLSSANVRRWEIWIGYSAYIYMCVRDKGTKAEREETGDRGFTCSRRWTVDKLPLSSQLEVSMFIRVAQICASDAGICRIVLRHCVHQYSKDASKLQSFRYPRVCLSVRHSSNLTTVVFAVLPVMQAFLSHIPFY